MRFTELVNTVLFPVRQVLPQPLVARIPFLLTNEEIRYLEVLKKMRGYVLDIGCGDNGLVRQYRNQGGRGLGLDVYDWGGQDLLVKNSAVLPFDDNTFDTVMLIACMNHIPNRQEVLIESRRVLNPDGTILFTRMTLAPLLSPIWHKYAFWDEDQTERGMKEGEVWGLSMKDVTQLLARAGLEIKSESSFNWGLHKLYICS